jgi:excisionase family DNA binding protein
MQHSSPSERRAHTLKEAASALRISTASIYRHAARGKIRLIKIGGRTLVSETEIARLSAEGTR